MNILIYTSYFRPYISGITIYTERIISHVAKKNHINVLTFLYDKALPKQESANNVHIIRMPYLFTISKGFISPQSVKTFLQTVPKNDAVMITIPNVEALFLAVYARLRKKKVISIFHCEIYVGNGMFDRLLGSAVSGISFMQLLLSHTIVGYDDYVQSRWFYPIIKHKFSPSLPPIQVPEVRASMYKKLCEKKGRNMWIGFVGRISKEKGLEYLIDALAKLQKSIPNIELIFIGPRGKEVAGEERYHQRILDLLENRQIKHVFLGTVLPENLGSVYKSLDVLVTPSTNKTEAFGMAQVEGMLVGTPSVTSNLPGMRQPILLTGMGELVKPANSMSIQKGIEKIIKNRAHYTTHEKVHTAHTIFELSKVCAFYDDLFA